jgi:RNA polymerase sigma-70 factor (ECF subfamily)
MMHETQPAKQLTDAEAIQKILGGDTTLYELLIRRYNPVLYKTGRSYGYYHHDVEDIMQECFISAYTHLAKFRGESTFKTWLIKIMLNQCYQKGQKSSFRNEITGHRVTDETHTPMFSNQTDTYKSVANRELSHVIEKAVEQIPLDYRMVFTLREMNGLSVAETAEALGISEGNVKVRLNRAKGMLRQQIEKMYSAEEIFEFNLVYCDAIVNRVMAKINGPEE